jgi:hypothetical protein
LAAEKTSGLAPLAFFAPGPHGWPSVGNEAGNFVVGSLGFSAESFGAAGGCRLPPRAAVRPTERRTEEGGEQREAENAHAPLASLAQPGIFSVADREIDRTIGKVSPVYGLGNLCA